MTILFDSSLGVHLFIFECVRVESELSKLVISFYKGGEGCRDICSQLALQGWDSYLGLQ